MQANMLTVKLITDNTQLEAALLELQPYADRIEELPSQIAGEIRSLFDSPSEVVSIESCLGSRTDEMTVLFKPSDRLVGLIADCRERALS